MLVTDTTMLLLSGWTGRWAKMTSTHAAVAKLVTTNAFEGASNRMTSPSPTLLAILLARS